MVSRGKGLLLPLLVLGLGLFSGLGVSKNTYTINSITISGTPKLVFTQVDKPTWVISDQAKMIVGKAHINCDQNNDVCAFTTSGGDFILYFLLNNVKVTLKDTKNSKSCTLSTTITYQSNTITIQKGQVASCRWTDSNNVKLDSSVTVTLKLGPITTKGKCTSNSLTPAEAWSSVESIQLRGCTFNNLQAAVSTYLTNILHSTNVQFKDAKIEQIGTNNFGIAITFYLQPLDFPEYGTRLAYFSAKHCSSTCSSVNNFNNFQSTDMGIYDTATMGDRVALNLLTLYKDTPIDIALSHFVTQLSADNIKKVIAANSCWLYTLKQLGLNNLENACQKLDYYVKQNWINFFGVNPPDDIINGQVYKYNDKTKACVLQVDILPDYAKKDWPLAMQYKDIHDIAKVLSPQATLCDLDGTFYTFFDGFYGMIKSLLPGEVNKTVLPAILSTIAALVILFYIVAKHLVGVDFTNLKSNEGRNAKFNGGEMVKLFIAIFITILIVNLLGGVFEKSNAFVLFGIFLLLIGSAMLWSESKEGQDNKTLSKLADFFIKMLPAIIIASIITSSKVVETLGGEQLMSQLVGKVRLIPRSVPILGWFSNFFIVDLRFVTVLGYSLAFYIFAKRIAENLSKSGGGGGQPPSGGGGGGRDEGGGGNE